MPRQSLLRLIKRWKRYVPRKDRAGTVRRNTRGVYVLYKLRTRKSELHYQVVYIGVAGVGKTGGGGIQGGIQGRVRTHDRRIKDWSHFSYFEVHDNVTKEEILELEALLLGIFSDDGRIKLANKQGGSRKLSQLRKLTLWKDD